MQSERPSYEPLTAAHAAELRCALTDPRVYAHLTGSHPTTTAEIAAHFARMAAGPQEIQGNQVWWDFAVRLQGGEFIGRIQATIHDRIAEVGYLFGPAFEGRGYATEAVRWLHARLRDLGFVDSFWATVTPENAPSIRLLERLG